MNSELSALVRIARSAAKVVMEVYAQPFDVDYKAPHDPVINGYYLTTVGQREVALRQLNTALPASLRSNSF